jgi:tetratricopeptide (TPR) repeat protein
LLKLYKSNALNISEYTYLLNKPNAINDKQTQSLEKLIESFPYFQSARAMYLKGLYNQDSYKYNFALKTTAAHTADRSILFDFITSDEFIIIQKDIYEQKVAQLLEISVSEAEIATSEQVFTPSTVSTTTLEEIPISVETPEETINSYFETEEETAVAPILEKEATEENNIEAIHSSSEVNFSITEEITNPVLEKASTLDIESNDDLEISEKLEIGKPIAFSQTEKHSFHEWLQLTSFKPIDRNNTSISENTSPKSEENEVEEAPKVDLRQKKIDLIDKFIQNNPKITPAKDAKPASVIAVQQPDTSHLMTETLAKVYLEQKKYQKAIQAYEILILKYPEKSYFFADRIKDIKILQQNNN